MYHSWCVVAHFSISTKCLVKDYNKEMHPNWWQGFGISKPKEKVDSQVFKNEKIIINIIMI
jgi:hypothetical protein